MIRQNGPCCLPCAPTRRRRTETGKVRLRDYTVSIKDVIDKCAEYEDLEEQGLLLRLPCKVGDDVYFIPSKINYDLNIVGGYIENNRVYHQKVCRIVLQEGRWYVELDKDREYGTGSIHVNIFFQKTWFLTRTEAEEALRRMEEK